ncbi:MAG: type II secretion system protein [Symploca sp. SIO2E6]|nr:type II secretion system protein [Symploca sp. SIO2E6]
MITPKKLPPIPQSNQSGFTIIESLVAIVVVGILTVSIAPVIALSVANRVQARRVEIATEAAQFYIEGVRSGAIDPPTISNTTIDTVAAPPATGLTCDNRVYCGTTTELFCIDGDGDGTGCNGSSKDMIIQAAGYNESVATDNANKAEEGYKLGIRVYRADAFDGNRDLKTGKDGFKVAAAFTGGTGLRPSQAPLVEMTTEVVTNNTGFRELCGSIVRAQDPSNDEPDLSNCQ